MPHPRSYYSNFDGSSGTGDDFGLGAYPHSARGLFEDAVAAADPDVDFSTYLNGGLGVTGVAVIHAGFGGESSGDPYDIWSQAGQFVVPTSDGVNCLSFSMQPELLYDLPQPAMMIMGIFAHEFGHTLGLPDLWWASQASGVGDWALMGTGGWNGGGRTPGHLSPWAKLQLGFITATTLTADVDNLTVPPASAAPVVFRIKSDAHATREVFLVENRQLLGFDSELPGSGLLVWHIAGASPNNFVTACGPSSMPPKVRLIQADGLCQMETGPENRGDAGDPFPGISGNTRLGGITDPDSRAYSGDKSGILLDNITQVSLDMHVDVSLSEILQIQVPNQISTMQNAIDLAGAGDEIRLRYDYLAAGSFVADHSVRITGGWDPTFQVQDQLTPSTIEGTGALFPLLRVLGGNETVEVDNIVFRSGLGRREFQPEDMWRGGAIHITDATVNITRSSFENNAAGPSDGLPARGGAIAASNSVLTIEDCSFLDNTAKDGGDIDVVGGTLTVRDTAFEGGTLYVPVGGGLHRGGSILSSGAELTIEDCTFVSYSGAVEGGAIRADGSITLLRSRFENNDTTRHGGAVYLDDGDVSIRDCEFVGNHAGESGGGAYLANMDVDWAASLLLDNHSDALGGGAELESPSNTSRIRAPLDFRRQQRGRHPLDGHCDTRLQLVLGQPQRHGCFGSVKGTEFHRCRPAIRSAASGGLSPRCRKPCHRRGRPRSRGGLRWRTSRHRGLWWRGRRRTEAAAHRVGRGHTARPGQPRELGFREPGYRRNRVMDLWRTLLYDYRSDSTLSDPSVGTRYLLAPRRRGRGVWLSSAGRGCHGSRGGVQRNLEWAHAN
jgi:M6 family metalloprotease-like protein